MENTGVSVEQEPITIQAENAIGRIFKNIHLKNQLPQGPGQKSIAIFGAGAAIEVVPLGDYFMGHGLEMPTIVAYDKDMQMQEMTQRLLQNRIGNNFEYRSRDLSDQSSLEDERFDLIIIRKPDVHNSETNWQKIIKNGFDHLKPGGAMLVTTDLYQDFVQAELRKNGDVKKIYEIPDSDRIGAFITEKTLYIARKPLK